MLNDNRAEANQLRLAFKKIAKEKHLVYCLKFNARGVPCADGKCRYYPCCEWSQLYEVEVTAGGLKGSFYEGMPDSMKPKAKEKRPLDNITFGKNTRSKGERHHSQCEKGCNCDVEISPTLPLPHTVRSGDGRTLRAMGSAGSFVAAWLL